LVIKMIMTFLIEILKALISIEKFLFFT